MSKKAIKDNAGWRGCLTPEQHRITREKGTELPFSGRYWDFKGDGVYRCACCGNELFSSEVKFNSGTGWPSFWEPIRKDAIGTAEDKSHFMNRREVMCSKCDAHLGHVFPDGPEPTGMRYCTNSAALDFKEKDEY